MAKRGRPVGSKNKVVKVEVNNTKPTAISVIIKHIETNGSITRDDAMRLYGYKNFPQHIAYLKKLGYNVKTRAGKDGKNEYFFGKTKEESICEISSLFDKWEKRAEEILGNKKLAPKTEPKTEPKEITVAAEDMVVRTKMKDVILDHLKKHKTITSAIAMRKYRCLNLSNVIANLKEDGWRITRSTNKFVNDYNTASNRNNAYSTYTLESKTRKRTVYSLNCVCEGVISSLIPSYTSIHMTKDSAIDEAIRVVDELANRCNTFYGTSIIDFVRTVEMGQVKLYKREKVRKLFRKTFKITSLLNFIVDETEMEV